MLVLSPYKNLWRTDESVTVDGTDEHMRPSSNKRTMTVSLGRDTLFQYRRFTLYNSPYVAHDNGCAIDLYPSTEWAPSPVSGEVLDTRTVKAPPKAYAETHDHLILVDTGTHVARVLHVDPSVSTGDQVAVGDSLGTLVRAGFFAPWVPNHIHLGFREHDANHYRATGSLPLSVDPEIRPVPWDGTGTVVETGETWARLDSPGHPSPGSEFVGLSSDGGVLDGGLPHYDRGGLHGEGHRAVVTDTEVGTVSGRDVTWHDLTVRANGRAVRGIALYIGRDEFGIKLVGEGVDFECGDQLRISIDGNSP